jgi:hypothetical protein
MNTNLKTHFSIAHLNGNSFNMIPISSTQEVEKLFTWIELCLQYHGLQKNATRSELNYL